jgi:flagellar motility protein MotE (MotC chaperone)
MTHTMTHGLEKRQSRQGRWRVAGVALAAWLLVLPVAARAQEAPAAAEDDKATGALTPASEENMAWRATEVPVEDLVPAKSVAPAKQQRRPNQSVQAKDAVKPSKSRKPIAGEGARLPQEFRQQEFRQTAAAAPPPPPPPAQTPAGGEPAKKAAEPMTADEKQVHQYCINISSAAADARFAWEKKSMEEVAKDIDERIAKLEEKTEEYKKWLAKRDEFSSRAQLELVNIFSKMKPDAAAAQMADMNEDLAAALLLKLKPTNSSAILNQINPAKGARLSTILTLAAKAQQGGKRPEAQPAGSKPPVQPAGANSAPQDEKKL